MKKLIGCDLGRVAFDPLAKTVQLYDIPAISQVNILVVTNTSTGQILYSFADPSAGGTYTADGVLHLDIDTTAMSAADAIQVWVDISDNQPTGCAEDSCPLDDQYAEQTLPQPVAVAGIELPGRRTEQQSLPVALADEQVFDANLSAVWPVGSLGVNALSPTGAWLDVSRYRSLSFEVIAPAGVTVTLAFEASNDGIAVVAIPLLDSATPTNSPIASVSVAVATSRFFEGPVKYRYFRARVSTAVVGGIISTFTRLSMAPWSGVYPQNINAGAGGTLAVGGNIAVGSAPTTNPLTIGGADSFGKVRRMLTDSVGNIPVVGPDPAVISNRNPVLVTMVEGNAAGYGVVDLLYLILQELKLLRVLPEYLNNGKPMEMDAEAIVSDLKQQ